jgi:disulfide bond formation protein DsbB
MPNAATSPGGDDYAWAPIFIAWLVSLVATMGSLFFSEVMALPPCILCWYQRICMYPMVAIATVGIVMRDRGVSRYLWPLTAVGFVIATYHNLLYYHILPDSITPCSTGVSCTDRQIEWLGFITIPLLSFTAFAMIGACLLVSRSRSRGSRHENQ